ncbi:MAG: hypothetical protein ABL982_00195 [Vicinamibacterales bacterium]
MGIKKSQLLPSQRLALAISDTLREVKEAPSGHLYAAVMGEFSLDDYTRAVAALKSAGQVEERGHVLRWIETAPALSGPKPLLWRGRREAYGIDHQPTPGKKKAVLGYVTKCLTFGVHRGPELGDPWIVDHIPSGKRVVEAPSLGDAKRFAAEFAALPLEWALVDPTKTASATVNGLANELRRRLRRGF